MENLQLQQVQDTFGTFFKQFQTSTPGAKTLHWTYPQAGTCTVVGNFASGSKQLFVTVQQAIVLLLFNDDETLSFEEISEKTAIKEGALKSVLLPIVRSGMLVKHSSVRTQPHPIFAYGLIFVLFRPISSAKMTLSRSAQIFRQFIPSSIFHSTQHQYVR